MPFWDPALASTLFSKGAGGGDGKGIPEAGHPVTQAPLRRVRGLNPKATRFFDVCSLALTNEPRELEAGKTWYPTLLLYGASKESQTSVDGPREGDRTSRGNLGGY